MSGPTRARPGTGPDVPARYATTPAADRRGRHAADLDETQEEFLRLDEVAAAAGLGEVQACFSGGRHAARPASVRLTIGLAGSALVLAGLVTAGAHRSPALLGLLVGPVLLGYGAGHAWRRRLADGRAWVQLRRGGLAYRQAVRAPVTVGWDHVDDVRCRLTATRATGAAGRVCTLTVTAAPTRLELTDVRERLAAFGELVLRAAVPATLAELEREVRRGGCASSLPVRGRSPVPAWVADARGLSGPGGSVRWPEVSRVEIRRKRVDVHVGGARPARLAVPLTAGSSRSAAFAALVQRLAAHARQH